MVSIAGWATAGSGTFGAFPDHAVIRVRPPRPGESAGEEWRGRDGRRLCGGQGVARID
ncbi:MAG: hypothetical protein ACRDRV_22025 [Pseudonocardiaceae bacterium]